jgi:hypothetical protein
MPYRAGDEPAAWDCAGTRVPYREGDVTEEEVEAWRAANSCPCIEAGRACDGSCGS